MVPKQQKVGWKDCQNILPEVEVNRDLMAPLEAGNGRGKLQVYPSVQGFGLRQSLDSQSPCDAPAYRPPNKPSCRLGELLAWPRTSPASFPATIGSF